MKQQQSIEAACDNRRRRLTVYAWYDLNGFAQPLFNVFHFNTIFKIKNCQNNGKFSFSTPIQLLPRSQIMKCVSLTRLKWPENEIALNCAPIFISNHNNNWSLSLSFLYPVMNFCFLKCHFSNCHQIFFLPLFSILFYLMLPSV